MSWPTDEELAVLFNEGGAGDRERAAWREVHKEMARKFGKNWYNPAAVSRDKSARGSRAKFAEKGKWKR